MPRMRRRAAVLGLLAAAAGAVGAWGGSTLTHRRPLAAIVRRLRLDASPVMPPEVATSEPIPGGGNWRIDGVTTRSTSDTRLNVAAYASATSVNVGMSIDFHVSMATPGPYWVEIYRMGYYGGKGASRVAVSPRLGGVTQAAPKKAGALGAIACDWAPSWRLAVPSGWNSGYYLAVLTTGTGYRCYTPFVVRDDARTADLCVVIPFTTYQAYNLWPKNGRVGKSLYYGYKKVVPTSEQPAPRVLDYTERAFEVSFDRPYANNGLPLNWDLDVAFIAWAEEAGYRMVFAASDDLHAGRVPANSYKGLVFSGHDEYWSRQMRDHAAAAVAAGTSLVFLSANNVYWHIRMPSTADKRSGRLVTCYKTDADAGAEGPADRTARWREPDGSNEPEQSLLGVMYNGILPAPVPLVVQNHDHWFWAGTGVRDGDRIPGVVGFEADGLDADVPPSPLGRQVLLSASPYTSDENVPHTQNTSLIETDRGAIVFAAGSLSWPRSLGPEGDRRIQIATANVLNRIVGRVAPAAG